MVKVALLLLLLVPVLGAAVSVAGAEADAPDLDQIEWGTVAWLRDFGAAEAAARESGKPIFLLFQEVPG